MMECINGCCTVIHCKGLGPRRFLLIVLFILSFIGQNSITAATTSFRGVLESDQIIYTRIVIPRYTHKIVIAMFSSPSSLEIKANQDETNDATNKAKKHTAKPKKTHSLITESISN